MDDGLPTLPWSSFADFFKSRVYDQRLVNRPFLTYYEDDRQLHNYAEFGTVVQRAATYFHDQSLRDGRPIFSSPHGKN